MYKGGVLEVPAGMAIDLTWGAMQSILLGAVCSLVMPHAGTTCIEGLWTVEQKVPPAMTLEATSWFLPAFFSIDSLLANDKTIH